MDTKALRQKILDLAIRGKLVPQDPNDEPASVLLERIREEKKQMVKDGKLKPKDIKNDTIIFKGEDNLHYEKFQDGTVKCIEDEIPFEVPEGWELCRLNDVISLMTDYVANGSFKTLRENVTTYKEPNYALFIRTVDFSNDFKSDLSYIDKESYEFLSKSQLHGGELMLSNIGASIGKIFRIPHFDMPMSLAPNSIIVKFHDEETYDYFECMFKSFVGQDFLLKLTAGTAMPKFSKTELKQMVVPIAPLKEQVRISNECKKLLSVVDSMESNKEDLAEIIALAKSKILDLAIHGKLVPQNDDDEPASVLLERIRTEKESLIKQGKLKRNKKESIIYKGDDNSYYELIGNAKKCINDEIPFELPDGWSWARGKHVFLSMETRKPIGDTFNYIDIDSIDNKNNVVTKPKHLLSTEAPSRASRAVFNGSVVFSMVRPYLKNIAYIDESLENCIASTGLYICTSNGILYPQYMFLLMISPYVVNGLNQYMKGDNSPSINRENIENWLFPIPPYKEQIRIQEKVSAYLENILKIETNL